MLKIKVKIFFPLIETLQLTKTNMAIWISIDFLFAVFTFMKKFQQNLLSHVRLFRLSAVLIKQLVEYLLKQARSIWLQGNCRGPYRLSFLLYPSRNSQRKTHFPQNWTWWFERRTAAWITKICIIQSMLNVLEKDIFLPKLTSYFYHLIFSSYLMKLENLSFLFIFWVLLYLTCVKWTRATVTFIADIFSLIIF